MYRPLWSRICAGCRGLEALARANRKELVVQQPKFLRYRKATLPARLYVWVRQHPLLHRPQQILHKDGIADTVIGNTLGEYHSLSWIGRRRKLERSFTGSVRREGAHYAKLTCTRCYTPEFRPPCVYIGAWEKRLDSLEFPV